eukprot:GEMP01075063.1.p1 GENE.GEMP01075063.1~~GEMP01075063.1.p1  ORF type:complete len:109 (+),score=22.69 GEMP01075063.1:26-352(+)
MLACTALKRINLGGRNAIRAFGADGGREHLRPSGMKIEKEDIEHYHEPDLKYVNQGPPQNIVEERGQKWVKGVTFRKTADIYGIQCHDRVDVRLHPDVDHLCHVYAGI